MCADKNVSCPEKVSVYIFVDSVCFQSASEIPDNWNNIFLILNTPKN